jgi:hypothetical protein
MEEVQLVEKKIKKILRQKIFSLESICKDYSIKTVKYVLRQLIKKKEIGTISHDLYFRPRKSRYLPGYLLPPSADKIIKAVSKKTGELISVHGAVAINQVGLSTQVPLRQIFHTTGRSRHIKINGEKRIKLVHINPKKIIMPNTVTCHVVTALWYGGKQYLKPRIIKKLHDRLEDKYFSEVLLHVDKMPAWMKKVFIRYQEMDSNDPELQEDPNEYWQG